MAMALLRSLVGQHPRSWRIESSGTWAADGEPASGNAILALRGRGLDLSGHQARRVSRTLLEPFQLILVMERNHKEALGIEFPDLRPRIYLLSEMVDQVFDVDDPYGSGLDDYLATARELEGLLSKGLPKIEELSRHAAHPNE